MNSNLIKSRTGLRYPADIYMLRITERKISALKVELDAQIPQGTHHLTCNNLPFHSCEELQSHGCNQAKHSIHPGFVWGLVPEAPTSPAELVDAISESIPRVPGGCWLRLRLRSGLGRRQRRCRRNETEKGRGEDRTTNWGTKGTRPSPTSEGHMLSPQKKVIKSKSPCGPTTPINVGPYQPSGPNRFGSNGRELPIQAIKESSLSPPKP